MLVISNAYSGDPSSRLRTRTKLLFKNIAKALGLVNQQVYYGLAMAFGLLFVLPSLAFINFAYKYHFFTDRHITYYFLTILIFSCLGFLILRTHTDKIHSTSAKIRQMSPNSPLESKARRASEQNSHLSSMVTDVGGTEARSILCAPMVVGGEVIGAIHMWNKEHESLSTHDSKLVNSGAASLATAIVSARLHRLCESSSAPEVSDLNGLPE